jgi:hypothetical protein
MWGCESDSNGCWQDEVVRFCENGKEYLRLKRFLINWAIIHFKEDLHYGVSLILRKVPQVLTNKEQNQRVYLVDIQEGKGKVVPVLN